MKRITVTIEGKRPANATPERALELSRTLTLAEIGRLWGVSRQRVWQLVQRAKHG